ncbi:MAG: outer membrane protein assembly factor BamD [Nitrospirae bacterium]|nr:outer membrane protein assembly factor BamD [Nitrospirota bacterium]
MTMIDLARIVLGLLIAFGIAGCVGMPSPEGMPLTVPADQQAMFDEGMRAYQDRSYEKAVRQFQAVIGRFPGAPLLEEAQWMLGKSYESGGAFESALREYQSFQKNFPQSSHRYEAALRIGFVEGLRTPRTAQRPSARQIGIIRAGDPGEAMGAMEKMVEKVTIPGVLTMVVRGYGANGVYFRTDQAPVIDDRLSSTAAAAHARGLKVWVRIPSRHLPWFKVPGEERDIGYDPVKKRMTSTEALDLFNPTTLDRLGRLYLDMAATGVDGLVIDEDPWTGPWEGFSPAARDGFLNDFGETVQPDQWVAAPGSGGRSDPFPEFSGAPLFWKWVGWKNREALNRLAQVIKTVQERYPAMVWVRILPPAAVTQPHWALARSGIDLLEEKQRGVDYFGVSLSFQQNPDDAAAVLGRMKELIGDSKRVIALVPLSEEPWIAAHPADFDDTGLLFFEDEKAADGLLTRPHP